MQRAEVGLHKTTGARLTLTERRRQPLELVGDGVNDVRDDDLESFGVSRSNSSMHRSPGTAAVGESTAGLLASARCSAFTAAV